MQHKSFVILLIVILLLTGSRSALAQGTTPPEPADDSRLLQGNSYWFPNDSARAGIMKAGGNEAFASAEIDAPNISMTDAAPLAITPSAVVNGDFEQGVGIGWTESSSNGWVVVVPYTPSDGVAPHSGSWIAWLGDDDNENTILSQSNLSIVSPATLRLWYWIGSGDDCGYDIGYVRVNSNIIHIWNLCYANNTYGWVPLELDLNTYNGQTINLSIEVHTDSSIPSGLLIDDISIYGVFADAPYGYWAESFIQRLYNAGVTGGCSTSPPLYCTESPVSRDQMAIFLLRGIHGSLYSPPAMGVTTGFTDVPITYWAAPWIKQLAAEGITSGCGADAYCPQAPVTRAQMAVFLLRSKYGASYNPPAVGNSTGFSDVPTTYWAAAWVKQLVIEGITSGCATGMYCPEEPVTRAQMAVFLVRTFSLP